MKSRNLTLLFLLVTLTVNAQITTKAQHFYNERIQRVNELNSFEGDSMSDELYLSEWNNGEIYLKNQPDAFTTFQIRYFIYNQEFHLITPQKDTVQLLKTYPLDSIVTDNKKFVYTNYISSNKVKPSYFQELVDGKMKLLKRYSTVFEKGNKRTATGYETVKPDKYKIVSKLYFQTNGENAVIMPTKKEELQLMFNSSEMLKYINKNKLKIKKEKHLVQIFEHFNTL